MNDPEPPFDGVFEYAYGLCQDGDCYGVIKQDNHTAILLVPYNAIKERYYSTIDGVDIKLRRIGPPEAEEHE